jgi:demethylmenaquinone methyltransferase/2-methoxy-6-polyprenyl-1,4-benzoquinol methylase
MKMTESQSNPESEWFGYQRVQPSEKTAKVIDVFSSVAENYDLMNDLMSCGLHRLWKDHFVRMMRPRPNEVIYDIAGGTGDIAIRCAKETKGKANITVCDLNPDMLKIGRTKAIDHGWLENMTWISGNAETLPFKDNSADVVCIAFGLRNVTHIDQALTEFARVLKPGGRFFCMEFSPGVLSPLRRFYDLYSFTVLPWLGEKVAKDRDSYQYLAESIRQFPTQKALAERMRKAGLENVKWHNLMGGVTAIHSGWKL